MYQICMVEVKNYGGLSAGSGQLGVPCLHEIFGGMI